MTGNRIRILVADDHAIVRMGLIALLKKEKDMTVVGEAEDGLEAVAQAENLKLCVSGRSEAIAIALRKHLLKI